MEQKPKRNIDHSANALDRDFEYWSFSTDKGWIDPFSSSTQLSLTTLRSLRTSIAAAKKGGGSWFFSSPADDQTIINQSKEFKDAEELHRLLIALTIASRIAFLMEGKDSNDNLVTPVDIDGTIKRTDEAYGLLCKQLWAIEKQLIESRLRQEEDALESTIPTATPPSPSSASAAQSRESGDHDNNVAVMVTEMHPESDRQQQPQHHHEENDDSSSCIIN